ncbi:hypothetical protein BGX27_005772, partial [Mortierella sp. AM989]
SRMSEHDNMPIFLTRTTPTKQLFRISPRKGAQNASISPFKNAMHSPKRNAYNSGGSPVRFGWKTPNTSPRRHSHSPSKTSTGKVTSASLEPSKTSALDPTNDDISCITDPIVNQHNPFVAADHPAPVNINIERFKRGRVVITPSENNIITHIYQKI